MALSTDRVEQDFFSLVARATAYEMKYVMRNIEGAIQYKTVPFSTCGVHPWARCNFYTQSDWCVTLLGNIVNTGFSEENANMGGLAVEEVPVDKRPDGYVTYWVYNNRESGKDPKLSGLYGRRDLVKWGLCAHNHLLQICRAFLVGMLGWFVEIHSALGIKLIT